MPETKAPTIRILTFDISLSRPGAAVLEYKNGTAKIIALSHVRTDAKQPYAVRGKTIEAWAHLFIADNQTPSRPYSVILREKYSGKFGNHSIFTAHAGIDRAMFDFSLADTAKPIPQQSVKKLVVGKGRAEKAEVEAAVRELTGFSGEFAYDDESDAAAIGLAWLIREGYLEGIPQS
ncbi:crossover junction endodeoxyribonuclease RuvC [Thalassobacillus sp. CUG 92003]|uniref:crossover junction endodeoxyribonuclease RuvC n=1 Tax=Thalassobacillus sp. CUG 92003 TaxID=2736641 RepID=UPI0015E763B6|nr:crossover junction endodeoxyribonuclease RuvC [Thalassobacillus sp. CUG 92003]